MVAMRPTSSRRNSDYLEAPPQEEQITASTLVDGRDYLYRRSSHEGRKQNFFHEIGQEEEGRKYAQYHDDGHIDDEKAGAGAGAAAAAAAMASAAGRYLATPFDQAAREAGASLSRPSSRTSLQRYQVARDEGPLRKGGVIASRRLAGMLAGAFVLVTVLLAFVTSAASSGKQSNATYFSSLGLTSTSWFTGKSGTLASIRDPPAGIRRHWSLEGKRSGQLNAHTRELLQWRRPKNVKVVGLVFYMNSNTTATLSCYIERNLKRNGGALDHVIWIPGTRDQVELAWLERLIASEETYSQHWEDKFVGTRDFQWAYSAVMNDTITAKVAGQEQEEVVYVKVDDDVLFFEDLAIDAMVQRILEDPQRPFLVSSNVIQQVALAWVHYSMGAIDGYLPELPEYMSPSTDKPSSVAGMPYWKGPQDYVTPKDYMTPPELIGKHRFLPTPPEIPIDYTPIAGIDIFAPFGNALFYWPIAAQQHYSFLARLTAGNGFEKGGGFSKYRFDKWDFSNVRMGIQFFAMKRQDIVDRYPFPMIDDELYLSVVAPQEAMRHGVVDGRSMAAHYSYGPLRTNLDTTDIASRYKTFADENICFPSSAHLRQPFTGTPPPSTLHT